MAGGARGRGASGKTAQGPGGARVHPDRQWRDAQRAHLSGGNVKTFRLAAIARKIIEREPEYAVEFLDLSRLASEHGRVIYPCKTCVSTAMPLCHWPCSCYPIIPSV